MIEFMSNSFWGVRIWIWTYLLFSTIMFLGVMIYFFKEKIKKTYYAIRYPEKLYKVVMHFKGNMYKEYWRIIPDNKITDFKNKKYFYDEKTIIKDTKMFFRPEKDNKVLFTNIEGKKYTFSEFFGVKRRWNKFPEIHYFYNNPNPIKFELDEHHKSNVKKNVTSEISEGTELKLSSHQLNMFKENDLFSKLLTLKGQENIMRFVMFIVIANAVGTTFIILWLLDIIPK